MLYAIISDIHANLQALQKVLADAKAQHAESVVCLGDVVGYGPLPSETLRRVREVSDLVLAGNHDDAVSGRISATDFIDLAADAVSRHRDTLSHDETEWLRQLPYVGTIEGAAIAHGDFTDPSSFAYIDGTAEARANFTATDVQLMFVGHTHVPGIFLVGESGNIYRIEPRDFVLEDHKRYIVNPGSVGYPRESHGQCYSSYVLYDSAEHTIRFRQLPFSVASVMQRGPSPKLIRRRVLVAAAVAAALIVSMSVWRFSEKAPKIIEKRSVIEKIVYQEDPALTIEKKSITLPHNARSVRAGYRIERGAELADLVIVFRAADGSVIQALKSTPRSSANQSVKIPEGTISADFVVRRRQLNDQPRIKAFAPRWE